MKMHKRAVTVAVAGAVSLAGLGVVAASTSVGAVAATTGSESASPSFTDRLTAIKDALKGLVTDGTITQQQADQVATTLNDSEALRGGHGHGGHGGFGGHGLLGMGVETAAEALGLTKEELRTELREGNTLAEIAEAEGVQTQVLVDALVASATERVEQSVTDERITRERADEIIAALPERIATFVEEGFAGRGWGGRGGPDGTEDAPEATTPDAAPTTSGASLSA